MRVYRRYGHSRPSQAMPRVIGPQYLFSRLRTQSLRRPEGFTVAKDCIKGTSPLFLHGFPANGILAINRNGGRRDWSLDRLHSRPIRPFLRLRFPINACGLARNFQGYQSVEGGIWP